MLGNFVRPLRERIESNSSEPPKKDTTMKTTKKNSGIKVTAGVKAGGFGPGGTNGPGNHNRSALRIKAGIKAGTVIQLANHNRRLLALA
jgi:hypothetical protein